MSRRTLTTLAAIAVLGAPACADRAVVSPDGATDAATADANIAPSPRDLAAPDRPLPRDAPCTCKLFITHINGAPRKTRAPLPAGTPITVTVAATCLPDGSKVTLTVTGVMSSFGAKVAGGKAIFKGVTPSAPSIVMFKVTGPGCLEDTLYWPIQQPPACKFLSPKAGETILPGTVQPSLSTVYAGPGATTTLSVSGTSVGAPKTFGPVSMPPYPSFAVVPGTLHLEAVLTVPTSLGPLSGKCSAKVNVALPNLNDTCSAAKALTWTGVTITESADTTTATSDINMPWQTSCTSDVTDGPDLFYAITLPAGAYALTLVPGGTLDPALYVLSACSPNACVKGSDLVNGTTPLTELIALVVTSATSYIIGVDSYDPSEKGKSTLTITRTGDVPDAGLPDAATPADAGMGD